MLQGILQSNQKQAECDHIMGASLRNYKACMTSGQQDSGMHNVGIYDWQGL
jgi:hypothetical protein